jgi:hypothetical protein
VNKDGNFVENTWKEMREKIAIESWKHIGKAVSTRRILQEGRGNMRERTAGISKFERKDRAT